MSQGGLSRSQVESIAQSIAQTVVRGEIRPLQRDVADALGRISRVEGAVSRLTERITEIEAEMRNIASSINTMTERLSGQLGDLKAAAAAQVTATTVGLEAAKQATERVDDQVARNTTALVEMEFLRLYNEARGPLRFVERFVDEIEERFTKAIEAVHINRELYNEHFQRIETEHSSKVRTIGSHIFEVLESDFQPVVEHTLTVPRTEFAQLALAVDERRNAAREEQLNTALERLGDLSLEPLVNAATTVQSAIRAQSPVPKSQVSLAAGDEIAIPLAVRVQHDGRLVDVSHYGGVNRRSNDPVRFGFNDGLESPVLTATLQSYLPKHPTMVQAMSDEKLERIKGEIGKLAAEGLIDPTLAPGYLAVLDAHGLNELGGAPTGGQP